MRMELKQINAVNGMFNLKQSNWLFSTNQSAQN